MNTILLINIIEHIALRDNKSKLIDLARQIAVDPELGDVITIESFNREQYTVRNITNINKILHLKLC